MSAAVPSRGVLLIALETGSWRRFQELSGLSSHRFSFFLDPRGPMGLSFGDSLPFRLCSTLKEELGTQGQTLDPRGV